MSTALAERIRARARQMELPLTRLALEAQVNRSFVYDILYGRSQNPTRSKLDASGTGDGRYGASVNVQKLPFQTACVVSFVNS